MFAGDTDVKGASISQPPAQQTTRKKSAQIDIPLFLQGFTGDAKKANVSGNSIAECLEDFVRQFPATKELLFDRYGKLLKYLDVYVNGESSGPEQSNRNVNDGDRISFLYLIVGG